MIRSVKYVFEFISTLVAITVVVALTMVWRLASGPIQSNYFLPMAEAGLHYLFPNSLVKVETAFLEWDPTANSIVIKSDNVTVNDIGQNNVFQLPTLRLRFELFSLLTGHTAPEKLDVDGLKVLLTKDKDGRIALLQGGGNVETADKKPVSDVLKNIVAPFLNTSILDRISVTNTTLYLKDPSREAKAGDLSISIPDLTIERVAKALVGKATVHLFSGTQPSAIRLDYQYVPQDDHHIVRFSFDKMTPSKIDVLAGLMGANKIEMPLDGNIRFQFDRDLKMQGFDIKLSAGEGDLTLPDLWDKAQHVKKLTMTAALDPVTRKFEGPTAEAMIGNVPLTVTGHAAPVSDKGADYNYEMTLKLKDVPIDHISLLWPKDIIPDAISWIKDNMSKGSFPEGSITMGGVLKWDDLANMTLDTGVGKIAVKGATVQYIAGVPVVEDVNGDADYDLRHMTLHVQSGRVGKLKVLPSVIELTDFEKDIQYISIPLKISGPAYDVLHIIDAEPLGYTKDIGLYPNDVSGNVDGLLTISLPLLEDVTFDDVKLNVLAKLTDFSAPKLISGYALSKGTLDLALDLEKFTLNGPIAFNDVPLDLQWEGFYEEKPDRPLYNAHVTGNAAGDVLGKLGLSFLTEASGTTAVDVKYTQPTTTTGTLTGALDFKKTAFRFERINWNKAVDAPLDVAFVADMPSGKDITVKTLTLKGATEKANGTAVLDRETGQLLALDLKPLVAGRTNAAIKLTRSAKENGTFRVEATGESLDISGRSDPTPSKDAGEIYTVKLKKLFNGPEGFISDIMFNAKKDKIGWSEIAMKGSANGVTPMLVNLAPKIGEPRILVLSIEADNFGQVMKGMGYTDTIHNGKFSVSGASTLEKPRTIEGSMKIGGFTVTGLPVLARLLSAASPFGFADLISGESNFERLKGNFSWDGKTIHFQKANAVGSAYGVNINGPLDIDTGVAKIEGTLVPFSMMNNMINSIPLVGGLITGGDNQGILAVAYSVEGPLSDPSISANPASLLTPGVFRNLFFGTGG